MSTIKVTDAIFEAEVLKSATPVVVDFWGRMVRPLQIIGPAFGKSLKNLDPAPRL